MGLIRKYLDSRSIDRQDLEVAPPQGPDPLDTTVSGGLELVHQTEERIVGPILGRYLACYAVRDQQGFVAYAKICESRPICPWSALTGKKVSSGPHPGSSDAIEAVIAKCEAALRRRRKDRLSFLHSLLGDAE